MTDSGTAIAEYAAPLPPASSTQLRIPEGLSFQEWAALGTTLSTVELGINWWIGDWLNYGERRYGDMYEQATLETGREKQTLADLKWVASKFETSRRRENLSWSHHRETASLEPAEADRMLDRAESGKWSKTTLRDEVQNLKKAVPAPKAPPTLPAPPDTETTSTEPEDESPDPDLVTELEEADKEIRRLQSVVEAVQSDDPAARVLEWAQKYAQLEGHLERQNAKLVEADRIIKSKREILAQTRRLLKVEYDGEIIGALQDLLR